MHTIKKLVKLKIILILVLISSSFMVAFICALLKDVPIFSSLLKDYETSGNSIFFPSLTYINLLWFLPEKYQILQFSVGRLIDIIIILNCSCYIETIFYHYIKNVCINGEVRVFYYNGSCSLESKETLESKENFYTPSQDLYVQKDELRYYKQLDERDYKLNERINKFRKKLFYKKSNFTFNNGYKISYYYFVIKKFLIFQSKTPYYFPQIFNFTDFNEHFQEEGKYKW